MNHLITFTVRYSCNDPWLDSKMYQFTNSQQHQLVDKQYPVITIDSFDDLNNYIDQADWLFVQMSGDFIVDRDHIWSKLHSIPDDVGLIGHILWDPNDSDPHLHHQCIVINTKALKGKPLDFYSKTTHGTKFIRNAESLHGNYCPLEIILNDFEGPRVSGFGTDVMAMILANGYRVVNFDRDWRKNKNHAYISNLPSRGFFNPDIGTELFARCFKTLTIDKRLDPAQKGALAVIKSELEYKWLNVYHWDGYPTDGNAEIIISPANGFMGECMARSNNAKKIVFYDINKNNLDFKRKLYSEWDGKDYEKYYTKFARERGLKIDPHTPQAKETAKKHSAEVDSIIKDWNTFKNMDVEFVYGDIISITDQILSKVTSNSILHTSTILNYYIWSNIIHDRDEIEHTRNQIETKIKETNSLWFETH